MIGKPEWFGFRMGGKDKSIAPDTWQGWLYLGVFLGTIYILLHAPGFWLLNDDTRKPLVFIWTILGISDIGYIWYQMLKDRNDMGEN